MSYLPQAHPDQCIAFPCGPVYTQPSISYFYLLPSCYSVSAYMCSGLCVCVSEDSWRGVVLAWSNWEPYGYFWLMDCRIVSLLVIWVYMCVLSHQKLYLYEPKLPDVLCCISGMRVCRLCCSVICQRLGYGSVWLQLCRETDTAARYCPCTCYQGTSLAKNASQQCCVICALSVLFHK